jgi:hypothetical protein
MHKNFYCCIYNVIVLENTIHMFEERERKFANLK